MDRNSFKDLQNIVSRVINNKIDRGEAVVMSWAVNDVLGQFPDVSGGDVDFYLCTARNHVLKIVKASVKKYEPTGESSRQIVLDGFEHLQSAYPVDRHGERVLVPVDALSIEELEARALELEVMAAGCINHAKEIRSYIAQRRQAI